MASNHCREFLAATRATANPAVRQAMAGAAVLGGKHLGYTVELHDGAQIEVGRQCCMYCARAEAYSKVASRLERGDPLCDYALPSKPSVYARATGMGPKPPDPPRFLDLCDPVHFVAWHRKNVLAHVLRDEFHANAHAAACWYACVVQAERMQSLTVRTVARMLHKGAIPGVASGGQLSDWLHLRVTMYCSIYLSNNPDKSPQTARVMASRGLAKDLHNFWGSRHGLIK